MDNLIQVLDGLGVPTSLDEEKQAISETFGRGGVVALQQMLGVYADGALGNMTRGALKNWQSQNGLLSSGIWDQQSRELYLSGNAKTVKPPEWTTKKPSGGSKPPAPGEEIAPVEEQGFVAKLLNKAKENKSRLLIGGLAIVAVFGAYVSAKNQQQ